MKKSLVVLLLMAVVLAFTACNREAEVQDPVAPDATPTPAPTPTPEPDDDPPADDAETVNLLVWGPLEGQPVLEEAATRFQAMHPDVNFNFTFGVVSEAEAVDRFLEDPGSAADVFAFPDDRLRDLVNAGGLYQVTRNLADIQARNMDGTVNVATLDGRMWAYPLSAANGYFLFYDRSVLSSEDVLSLDRMIEVSLEAGMQIIYPLDNAWIAASWFLSRGDMQLEDGRQIVDWNDANGLAAAEAMIALEASGALGRGWVDELQEGIGTSYSAGVGGMWMVGPIQDRLGDNFGATKLPTATMGGQQVQLSSFLGSMLVGVSSQSAYPVWAMDFADFFTGQEMQQFNFDTRSIGPSNIAVANSPAVAANPGLAALAYQSQFAFPQRDANDIWGPLEAFGSSILNNDTTPVQERLDEMVAQIMGN